MKISIGKYPKNGSQKISIKIDKWDTYNMYQTLAMIIVPMLRQLKKTTHGAPDVNDEDVPLELKSTSAPTKVNEWDIDDNHFKRWDYVLGEMIWAFDQIAKGRDPDFWLQKPLFRWSEDRLQLKRKGIRDEAKFKAYHDRITKGLMLFGKYYRNLWD